MGWDELRPRCFCSASSPCASAETSVSAGRARPRLAFPRDEGSYPDFRIEWWYVTGQLDDGASKVKAPLGFRVTFFRVRTGSRPTTRAASRHVRCCSRMPQSPTRSAAAPPRTTQRTNRGRPGVCPRGPTGREAGRLVNPAGGARQVRHGRSWRGLRLRTHARIDAAAVAAGRARLQPQGAGSARGELLLQPAAARGQRRNDVG